MRYESVVDRLAFAMGATRKRKKEVDLPSAEAKPRGEPIVRAVCGAALDELAEKGFASFSMESVAERAGVNKTTVYRRYPTKVDLVQAALQDEKRALLALVDHGNLRDDLIGLVQSASRFMSEPRGRGIFRTMLTDHADPELADLVHRLRRDGEREPRVLLQRGIARGELRPDVNTSVLLHAVFGAVIHRVFLERREFDRADAGELVDMVLNGVAPAARRGTRERTR